MPLVNMVSSFKLLQFFLEILVNVEKSRNGRSNAKKRTTVRSGKMFMPSIKGVFYGALILCWFVFYFLTWFFKTQ